MISTRYRRVILYDNLNKPGGGIEDVDLSDGACSALYTDPKTDQLQRGSVQEMG